MDDEFECEKCHTTFRRESTFLVHKCKQMLREEELRSVIGQAAWSYYQKWIKAQRKTIPATTSFVKSRYFRSFIKFTEFVKATQMTDPDLFIKLMVEKTMQPTIWCNDQVYSMYLEHLEFNISPLRQIQITVRTMCKIADIAECEVEDVFELLPMTEILHLIRQRKLSPWVLLNSVKFKAVVDRASEDEHEALGSLIHSMYWQYKFEKHPEVVQVVKKCVKELNI